MSEELFTEKTIAEFFGDLVKSQPDHPFIMYPDRNLVWSYKDFDERTDNMAKGLLAIGVKKGDHVGVWARNVPEWLTLMFATAKIGAVLVTINTNYKSHELEYLVKQSDMHTLAIVDGLRDVSYVDVLYELVPELKVQPRGTLKSARFPRLKNVVYLGQEKHRGMYTSMELFQLGENMDDEAFEAAKHTFDQNDVVNMQYTSGTTGFPKGVMLTSRNILNNGFYIGERQLFTKNDRVCVPVPLFHCFGCVLGIMAILSHGATAVMVEQFDPLIVLASIQKAKATAVYGVPTMYIAELNHPMFSMFDMSSLRTGIMSGSLCPVELMKQVIEKMHMPEITIPYGLTEASPVFTMSGAHETLEHRVTTVGTGQPHIEIKIIDPETGKTVPPNTVGELCCRGYNVMKGYYNMPEETAKAIDADGWLHSGDLGTVDEDGYYKITGRLKDMIIRGGENIYPKEIEEFLRTHEAVEDAEVVGIPDQRYGEVVGAFVIPRKGMSLTEDDLREYCRHKIAFYKTPKHFFIVEGFPQTASGKIQKFKLREQACQLLGIDPALVAKNGSKTREEHV
ncbi:MAG: AMP-binding protein [Victivallales bacterium]|nr:AMP-binding protein [Victivallales bacterium]